MGALDYLSNFCTVTSTRNKRKPMQVMLTIPFISPKTWQRAPALYSTSINCTIGRKS